MKDPFITSGVMKDPFVALTVMKGPLIAPGVMKGPFMTSGHALKAPFTARRPTEQRRKPATQGLPAIPSTWRSPITPAQGGTTNGTGSKVEKPPP
ncbi:hypothetical protein H4W32_004755 [Actinophytocola algeriensis]|uniref:Uncharacterized protein n=1 Tax=Actinophytocola algeriensis TaxID=1768010 RepID=A0A7W7Q073_9PSEU|nr:hypothetical protein [Actinophytocola algeriensis]MBE1476713.1 hypothetical protein [Actinophytocola algeriensis]